MNDGQLTCANVVRNKNFIDRDDLFGQIASYCDTIVLQWDGRRQGSLPNTEHVGRYAAEFKIDYNDGLDLASGGRECIDAMVRIIDSTPHPPQTVSKTDLSSLDCGGNDPNNPAGWKFGGSLQLGSNKYTITPTAQGYAAGICFIFGGVTYGYDGKRYFYKVRKPNVLGGNGFALQLEDQTYSDDSASFQGPLPAPITIEPSGLPIDGSSLDPQSIKASGITMRYGDKSLWSNAKSDPFTYTYNFPAGDVRNSIAPKCELTEWQQSRIIDYGIAVGLLYLYSRPTANAF